MAFWPSDERNKRPIVSKRKGRKVLEISKGRDYPNLEPGLIGAATLSEGNNNKLEWDFLTMPNKDFSLNRLNIGKRLEVFPQSPPLSSRNTSRTVRQRAEQGANFLRTYLPDVEIPSELIRDQLLEETQICDDLEVFDPYSGNLLEVSTSPQDPNSALLLFPTGDTNRDLTITYVRSLKPRSILFRPTPTPLWSFSTPIQQIETLMGLGTSTEMFSIEHPNHHTTTTATTRRVARFSRSDTNDEVIVDAKIQPFSESMLVISDQGTLFNCTVQNGERSAISLHTFSPSIQNKSGFWRLSLASNGSVSYVMSEKTVEQFDNRTNTVQSFLSIANQNHILTSIESCRHSNILPLCSTDQVIWMDTRFTGKPLLAYSHGRQRDRYISTQTLYHRANTSLTFLTSRNNGLVTVYDVSRPSEGLFHLNDSPYSVFGSIDTYQRHLGQQFLSLNETLGLVRLSELKGVEFTEILSLPSESRNGHAIELSEDVIQNRDPQAVVPADLGPLSIQEFSQVNLNSVYKELFQTHFEKIKRLEEEDAEMFHDMVDNFPRYLQSKEIPTDHILTTYDIAFCAGEPPGQPGRADFLTESLISSKRGYRALKQGRLSAELVRSPWHRSISSVLRHLDPSFPSGPLQSMEYLQSFQPLDNACYSNKAREYAQDSCEQLTVDLALGSDIYFDDTIFNKAEAGVLEVMTQALSIDGGPPPIRFGYLTPVEKNRSYYAGESQISEGLRLPLGVRLLLNDWDSGNPDDYIYKNPYAAAFLETKQLNQPATLEPTSSLPVKLQRPPQIMASNTVSAAPPEIHKKLTLKSLSQDPYPPSINEFKNSQASTPPQGLATSTQIMPGPHGGRPAPKKKPPKKRLGGF
uniref:Uncharacterized protein n=1 Tax=Psilocybe cubensis TaxID=181762 RepID=A0A8H7Y4I7_PSICU